jgi:hypothetical protein
MRFNRDPPPPQETISPKTMARTAVHMADSMKRCFSVDDISPPIPHFCMFFAKIGVYKCYGDIATATAGRAWVSLHSLEGR